MAGSIGGVEIDDALPLIRRHGSEHSLYEVSVRVYECKAPTGFKVLKRERFEERRFSYARLAYDV